MATYLQSSEVIKAFPAVGRTYEGAAISHLMTEDNVTEITKSLYGKKSFVISTDSTTGIIEFVLNGYYFKVENSSLFSMTPLFVFAKITDTVNGDNFKYQYLLNIKDDSILDLDYNSEFEGLAFSNSSAEFSGANIYSLQIFNSSGVVPSTSKIHYTTDEILNSDGGAISTVFDNVTSNIVTANITTAGIETANITIADIRTETVGTSNITTANITTENTTTADITTANIGTENTVTSNIDTANITTENTTTANITTANITTANINNVTVTNNITASSFTKTGGTATQFLKADGSTSQIYVHNIYINYGGVAKVSFVYINLDSTPIENYDRIMNILNSNRITASGAYKTYSSVTGYGPITSIWKGQYLESLQIKYCPMVEYFDVLNQTFTNGTIKVNSGYSLNISDYVVRL